MPVIGAFLWGVLLALGRVLLWVGLRWGGTLIANLLLALGVSFVAVRYTQPALRGLVAPAFSALPSSIAPVMAYVGFDVAVSIIISAALFKMGKGIVKGLALKGAQS